MEIPIEWYTERDRPVPGPSWTGEDMAEWDEQDREAAQAAMDTALYERVRELEAENQRLRDRLVTWRADYMEED